jgi:IS30 family transposase
VTSGRAFGRGVRREFVDRVCTGSPVKHAAGAVGVSHQTGVAWWRDAGAMTLVRGSGARGLAHPGDLLAPGGGGHRLSFGERIEIMRGRDAGLTGAEIGRRMGRDRSVIWRELARNSNPDGDYHARLAHARASQKACRPKASKLDDPGLCSAIETWMDDGWSPKLIAAMLARDHPDDKLMRVSHETIYQCLYVQTRGSLRADLHKLPVHEALGAQTARRHRAHRGLRRRGVHH